MLLRVAAPLRLFVRGRAEVEVRPGATDTLGHVVEAAGVPLPEVGSLLLDGAPVAPSVRAAGRVADVLPAPRPQPLDGPPRLLLDVHLGTLARRLRLLGVDTAWSRDADDDALVAQAAAEDRLLLTRDRGLLRRRALRRAAHVRADDPDAQLRDLLERFPLPLAPYTRCPACNGLLEPVAKAEVLPRLPFGTARTYDAFSRCRDCDRVYWAGAHARRLAELVAAAQAPRERR